MVNYVSVDGVSFKVFFTSRSSQFVFEKYVFEDEDSFIKNGRVIIKSKGVKR